MQKTFKISNGLPLANKNNLSFIVQPHLVFSFSIAQRTTEVGMVGGLEPTTGETVLSKTGALGAFGLAA